MRVGLRSVALAGLLAAVGAWCGPVRAASLLEKNFWMSGPRYDAVLPPCDDLHALSKIRSRFAERERTYWNSALELLEFERIREVAFRPWAVDTIPRRWCRGEVLVSDGVRRRVNYFIGEDTGMIGATWGVEWCVVGLDRNWAYNPSCRMAQP